MRKKAQVRSLHNISSNLASSMGGKRKVDSATANTLFSQETVFTPFQHPLNVQICERIEIEPVAFAVFPMLPRGEPILLSEGGDLAGLNIDAKGL